MLGGVRMEIILGKMVGTGGVCNVYDLGNGKVIKLYFEGYDKATVEWEYNKTVDAYQKGLSVPQVYKIVEYHNRYGLIMEKIEGQSLMEIMFSYIASNKALPFEEVFNSLEVLGNIKITAQMLYKLHSVSADLIDNRKNALFRSLKYNVHLTDTEKRMISEKISILPEGNND